MATWPFEQHKQTAGAKDGSGWERMPIQSPSNARPHNGRLLDWPLLARPGRVHWQPTTPFGAWKSEARGARTRFLLSPIRTMMTMMDEETGDQRRISVLWHSTFKQYLLVTFTFWGGETQIGPLCPGVKQIDWKKSAAEPLKCKQNSGGKTMKEPELIYFNVPHCEISLAYRQPPADKWILNLFFFVKNDGYKQWVRVLFRNLSLSINGSLIFPLTLINILEKLMIVSPLMFYLCLLL